MKKYKEHKGITLIALVVSIIVLLILAGISINMLTGQNGILNRTREAKEKTLFSQQEENSILTSYEDQISNYVGIDWEQAKANAKAPEEQKEERNKNVIGIGTNGKVINMDLWEYTFDSNTSGYCLNDEDSLKTEKSAEASSGYLGNEYESIIIPQYISIDNGVSWTEVTNLDWTFFRFTRLKEIDKIPSTVKSMRYTFRNCDQFTSVGNLPGNVQNLQCTFLGTAIEEMPNIPQTVNNMIGTFNGCSNLKTIPNIPKNIEDLTQTFYQCTHLEKSPKLTSGIKILDDTFNGCQMLKYAPEIPDGVESMSGTFEGCIALNKASKIPESVRNITKVYYGCINLNGTIEINASVTGKINVGPDGYSREDYFRALYKVATANDSLQLKVTGTCNFLNEIITQSENTERVILAEN